MVSAKHDAIHRTLQEDPASIGQALQVLGMNVGEVKEASVLSPDATEACPLERRADAVILIETAQTGSFLVIVEVQLRREPSKWSTWLYYLAYMQEKHNLPTTLLVLCTDRKVARWADIEQSFGPLLIAQRSATLRPIVCGPGSLPKYTTADAVAGMIPLAALSVITHADDPDVEVMMTVLAAEMEAAVPGESKFIFADLVSSALTDTQAGQKWRTIMLMSTSYPQSPLARAVAEQAAEQAAAQTLAKAIVDVLKLKDINMSDDQRDTILACRDAGVLGLWFERAVNATSIADVF